MTQPFTVDVTVTTAGGTSVPTPGAEYIYLPPTITEIDPASGPLAGGTSVTITGSGFPGPGFTGTTAVGFGQNQAASFVVNSATSITATSPAATTLGPVDVTVTLTAPDEASAISNAVQFAYPRGVLFHQNMRNYGGGTVTRNNQYEQAFTAIATDLNPVRPSVLIAGFTELTNDTTAPAGLNSGLCAALGVGPAQAVCTRETAAGAVDYTGIAYAAGVNIQSWGRVVPFVSGQRVELVDDVWNPQTTNFAGWAAELPTGATLDYQSLVYVVADISGGPPAAPIVVAVAFLHNIFNVNDNKSAVLQNLPGAARRIVNDTMGGAGVVYVCGDFNTGPRTRGTPRTGQAVPFSVGTILPPGQPPAWSPNAVLTANQEAAGFTPGGTTAAGSLYDYSFLSVIGNFPPQLIQPQPAINVATLDTPGANLPGGGNLMSDHTASLLNI
jgi:hypothetical protein